MVFECSACLTNDSMSTAAVTTTTMIPTGPICFKCGTIKKSGKLSCCAPGGAWFKNCGNAGDSKFEHTWIEGVQACKSPRLTERKSGLNGFYAVPAFLGFLTMSKCQQQQPRRQL